MDLEKTKVVNNDSWNDIVALEQETKLLLETVKGKNKPKKSTEVKGKLKQTQKSKPSAKDTSSNALTLNLFAPSKATVEVLDDAPPDSTPREGNSDEDQRRMLEKQKRAQMLKLEQAYRTMSFKDESQRVKDKKDVFTPSSTLSLEDIEAEKKRLFMIEQSSKLKHQRYSEDMAHRSSDLRSDRAALRVQAAYRGHLGRRRMSLMRYILETTRLTENPSDWVQIHDKDTGDSWYYNKITNQSQWEKPGVLKEGLPSLSEKAKRSRTGDGDLASPVKTLTVSMSLPTLKAGAVAKHSTGNARKVLAQSLSEKGAVLRENAAQREIDQELKIHKLNQKDALLGPDGAFKPQLRSVVVDALLDTRFDNVSTVLADARWFDQNEEAFAALDKQAKQKIKPAQVEARVDLNKTPMVAVMNINPKKAARSAGIVRLEAKTEEASLGPETRPSDLTLNNIAHKGFDAAAQQAQLQGPMCFGCWSAGFSRKCSLHDDGSKPKPSQTMLLCRNWDLDVMRRRYRSEEIQEIFLQQESSLRFDVKHRKFYTVVEQRHPIYRLVSQNLEAINSRMNIFCRVKFWMRSMAEEFRAGRVDADREDRAQIFRIRRGMLHMARIDRLTKASRSVLPLAPITGYSWAERLGQVQHLFKHLDMASGQEVDIIVSEPTPIPKELYRPREYHVALPKTFPLPRPGTERLHDDPLATLPANSFIDDLLPSAWMERIASATAREGVEAALAQVRALTPVTPLDVLSRAKRPAPSTMKFATIANKPTPGNLAVGGLPVEMLVYQLISTFVPPQYGSFMVMDKGSVSPAVSAEITISFRSLVMPPTQEPYVERALEHALNYRRVPTICLNTNVAGEDKHHYGRNRPEQTGEQEAHGFRTTAWAPQMVTPPETDPQAFVPGQAVASLNVPKANLSYTTHADVTYPFCEPSSRDNSTLDFYHLLLFSVVSMAKAQVFTGLTVQEPGQFQKGYRLDLPLGHLVVSVYRSWAYRQQDTIQEFKTDDGVSYWYHRKTGQTFWERPRGEPEEASPLQGGIILDLAHTEEPMVLSRGEQGLDRRYDQGEFREMMLNHIESKKDAVGRRKAAAVTVRGAKERGVIPPLLELASVDNLPASSQELGGVSHFDPLQPSLSAIANTEPSSASPAPTPMPRSRQQEMDVGSAHDLMDYYAAAPAPSQVVRGSNLDEPSAFPGGAGGAGLQASVLDLPTMNMSSVAGGLTAQQLQLQQMGIGSGFGGQGAGAGISGAGASSRAQSTPYAPSGGQRGQPAAFGALDGAMMNNLTQTIGAMFANMMSMDRSNPQDMIQLGLGMGMALMQSGAVNSVAQGQIHAAGGEIHAQASYAQDDRGDYGHGTMVAIPSFADDNTVFSQSQAGAGVGGAGAAGEGPAGTSAASVASSAAASTAGEPIGRAHPTAVLSSDRPLDHREEQTQRSLAESQLAVPLSTMEKARNLAVEPKPSDTPDVLPPRAAAKMLPTNADQAVFDEQSVPVLAYPELSTRPAAGAPATYHTKLPAGLGSRFVSREEEETQLKVPGAEHLRRTVMPLPVGFFDAIEAKHVAKQAVDYLPQVPNFPQSRTIGRVKPRSAAADWLMISFDPWSAGRNPLSAEYVPSLMARADRLLKDAEGRGADSMEQLRDSVLGNAFVNLADEAGMAQQRAEISKAQILAEDFKRLCSLCRHSKFADAEQLINQPDWAVPVDFQDDQGNALLHVAAQNGSKRLVKLCLRRGATLDLQNLTGQTALHFAFGYGYNEVGEYLVSKGADDSIRNKDGLTCYEGLGARELALL